MTTRAIRWGVSCAALVAAIAVPSALAAAPCVPITGASKADNWYCDPFVTPSDVEVDGTEPLVPSFPDAATRYAVLAYKLTDKTRVLRLHGTFASARFENLNVELFATDVTGLYTRVGNVVLDDHDAEDESRPECSPALDDDCGPDLLAASGCNPATSTNPKGCVGSRYEVALVDAASAAAWKNLHPGEVINVVPLSSTLAPVSAVRVTWRVADGGTAKAPTVSWESTAGAVVSGLPAPNLQSAFTEENVALGVAPCKTSGCAIETYHIDPGPGQVHNFATEYLGATLALLNTSTDVVVLKFRAPRSATTYPTAPLTDAEDLRYWSGCLGYTTTTTLTSASLGCSRDRDVATPADGYERIVVGPNVKVACPGKGTVSLAACAKARRHHYVTWGTVSKSTNRVFLYRNVMTNPAFPGWAVPVPDCLASPGSCAAASGYIGSWAPRGKHCTLSTYLSSPASCEAF